MYSLRSIFKPRIIGISIGTVATIMLTGGSYASEKAAVEKKLEAVPSEQIVSQVIDWVKANSDRCSLVWTKKIQIKMNQVVVPEIYVLAELTEQEKKQEWTETSTKSRIGDSMQEAMKKGLVTVNQTDGKPLVTFNSC